MSKLTEEPFQAKLEEFVADLEYNPDPDYTWRNVKANDPTGHNRPRTLLRAACFKHYRKCHQEM